MRVSDAACLAALAENHKASIELLHLPPNLTIVDTSLPPAERTLWNGDADKHTREAVQRFRIEAMRKVITAALNVA